MNQSLKTKDFITIGIFSALYIVIYMVLVTLQGFIPAVYFFSPAPNALLLAPIFMLFVARVAKPFAILLWGGIITIVFTLMMPAYWTVYVIPVICFCLSELFARLAKFKNFKLLTVSYVFFSLWVMGIFSTFYVFTEGFMAKSASYGYDQAYLDGMRAMIQPHILALIVVATVVCAVIGAFFAKKLLNKHFKKAGII